MQLSRLIFCLFIFTFASLLQAKEITPPKNIIYFIGDGMGPSHVSASRYFHREQRPDQPFIFDEFKTGLATTYPDDNRTIVTDSAASATALATGIKTYNGAIGVDSNKQALKTLFEYAKEKGKQTGLAVTSQVTHATPGSFYAHQPHRKEYAEIANWLVDNKTTNKPIVDVILGGGTRDLIREDRNIAQELKTKGYQYITDINQVTQIKSPALGLFHPVGFPKAIDSDELRLSKMTQGALTALSPAENGFVLLVEGSQIDWCAHENEIACLLAEMHDFENAINVAFEFAKNRDDTLIVITADHETGGLSIGANKDYAWFYKKIAQIKASAEKISDEMKAKHKVNSIWNKWIGFELTKDDKKALKKVLKTDPDNLESAVNDLINTYTLTGWTTTGHTGSDVQIFSYGVGSEHFTGMMDNTDIAKKLINFVTH